MAKKKKLWILVSALAVVLAAAVTAGALFLPGVFGWDRSAADPYVKWYSEETTEYVITTADQLYDMAYLSSKYDFEGQTFVLGADIVINEGDANQWLENAPSRLWYPIKGFAGTFDGQGHTISGLYSKVFNEDTGLFSETHRLAVVKNLKIVNSLIVSYGEHPAGFVSANGAGTFDTIYTDGILWSDNWNNGGIMGAVTANGDSLFTNCWFDGKMILKSDQGRVAGGIVGDIMMENGVCTVEHCLSTGTFSAEAITNTSRGRLMDIGGLVGRASGGTTNITDCFANTNIDSWCLEGVGTLIGSAGKSHTNITHSYVPQHESVKGVGYRYSGTAGDIYTYAPEFVTGFNAYKWTTLDFEEFWAVDEDGTPILQSFAETIPDLSNVEREIDTSWYTKVSTYRIKNYKQLLGLHVVSQFDNLSGKIIMLMDDIVVNEGDASEWRENAPELSWKGIGSGNVMFAGTFDGGGHSISGLYWKEAANGIGFIRAMGKGAIVRNFKLLNSYFETNNVEVNNQTYSYIGSVTGFMQGATLDRVYSNAIVVNDGYFAGGLCGLMRATGTSFITNSWFDGKVIMHTETGMRGGGILGVAWNGVNVTVSHCLMTGEMTSESWAWGANEGLIVGFPNEKSIVTIEDTLSAGSLTVLDGKKDGNGMIVGRISGAAISCTFKDVFAIQCKDTGIKNEEGKEWLANWGLTGYRGIEPIIEGAAVIMDAKYMTGYAAYQYSSLDFENYWDIDPNGHPVLKAFNENEAPDPTGYGKMVDYSWYDSSKETYYISNRRQLMGLSFLSSGVPFKDKTIYQTANITVNSGDAKTWEKKAPYIEWIPIGNANVMFQGTYNGGGHTISGVYVKEANNGLGLFGCIKDATIKNLKFTNSYIESNMAADTKAKGKYSNYSYIGGIAGYAAKATFDTIYTDVIIKNDGEMTGGIVGLVNFKDSPATLRKCWFDGTIIQDQSVKKKDGSLGATMSGGMIGLLRNNSATIEHCLSTATFVGQNVPDGTWGTIAAGFVARNDQTGTNAGGKLTIKDSFANIKIEGFPDTVAGNGTVIAHANPNTYLQLENVFAVSNSWPAIVANRTHNPDQTVESVLLPRMTGANAYMFSDLDFENYWVALEGKTPELKCFATGKVANPEDAFDDRIPDTSWYSDSKDEFVISNPSELLGFAELSKTKDFAGKTVKLGADIALNYGTSTVNLMDNNGILAGVDPWTSIGTVVTPFRGVFDGQGHSISGLAERASGQSALFAYVEDAFIQNVTIERSIFRGGSGGGKSAAIAANTAGTTTIKRVKVADSVRLYNATYEGGIVAYNTGNLIIDNVWSDIFINPQWSSGAQVGGILGGNANTAGINVTITNALFTGEFAGTVAGDSYVGGLIGASMNNPVTTVKDSLNAGVMGVIHGGAAGQMRLGTLIGTKSWTAANTVMEDVYATKESGRVYKLDETSTLVPTDEFYGTIRDDQSFDSGVYVVKTEDILGELAKTNASGLDYENYWITVEGKTPELLNATSGEPTPDPITEPDKVEKDVSWYNNTDTEFVLMDAADLNGFALLSQTNNFAGKTVKLGADITINEGDASTWATTAPELDWTPISTQSNGFQGTFDGQGHTISGLYMDDDNAGDAGYGLVGCINGGTVTNIKLVNSAFVRKTASAWTRSASIVGTAYKGTISNIYSDAYIYANGQWAGGIVGLQRAVKASGAVVESEVIISNCWYNGVITATSGSNRIGGITGGAHEGDAANVGLTKTTINNCLFTGHILSDYAGAEAAIAGIFGYTANTYATITDSLASGSIVCGTNNYVAGSYGFMNWNSKIIIEDLYVAKETAKYAYYDVAHNVSGAQVINIKAVAREDIFGDLAKTNASGLDYTNTWATKTDDVPVLKAFSDCVPMEPIVPEVPAVVPDTSWYNSSATVFEISTVEQLYGLAELSMTNSFSGKTIKLTDDIVVNTGNAADWATTAPERVWTAIASGSTTFEGTFDGQYHTISGLYSNNTTNGYAAFIAMAKGATIKNVKIVNSYFKTQVNGEYSATTHFHTVAAIIGRVNKGTVVEGIYTDAILIGGRHTGMIGFSDDDKSVGVTVKNCWFDGEITTTNAALDSRGSGGIMGQVVNNQISTFENCLFTGKISGGTTGCFTGGIVGMGPWNATIVMNNCLSAGDMSGVTMGTAGSVVGNNPGGNKSTYTNVYGTNETHANLKGAGGATFTASAVAKAEILGDLAKTKLSTFDFDTIWTTVENGVPVLRLEEVIVTPPSDELVADTSWYSDSATEFTIDTAAELLGLAELSKTNNFAGKTIKLGADIEFNTGDAADWATTAPENVWEPIGSNTVRFAGTIDGQGHTISGLYAKDYAGEGGYNYIALIHSTSNATIKNLSITNTYFAHSDTTWAKNIGVLVGCAYGVTIENVYTDAILEGGCFIGMVAMGRSANAISVTEAWFDGTIKLIPVAGNADVNAGGIFGASGGGSSDTHTIAFTDCLFTGTIQGSSVAATATNVGGIAGHTSGKMTRVTTTNCLSAGTITATGASGPAIGALFGNTFWKAPAKNFISNVYWTSETYNTPIVSSRLGAGQFADGAELKVADALTEAEILGVLAESKLTGFDFVNVWASVEDKLPELKKLSANNTPVVDPTVETTEWYGDGSATEFTISTVGELKGFVTLSKTNTFSGKTVKLGADIVWNEGDAKTWATTAPANAWTPIGDQDNGFLGTFDGQGHTISGLYCVDTNYASFIARMYAPGSLKNVNIVNSYFRSNGTDNVYSGAGIVARGQNAIVSGVYTDAILDAQRCAGIVASGVTATTITNCWFDGTIIANSATRGGGIIGLCQATATYTIENCLFTGTFTGAGGSSGYYGGIVGIGNWNATIKMTNCLAAGNMTSVTAGAVGAVVGNNPGGNRSTYTNVYATTETHANLKGSGGATFPVTAVATAEILGDLATTKLTGFDFTNTWATVENSTPVLKAFVAFAPEVTPAVDPTVETTEWYGDGSATEFTISTVGELKGFVTLSQTNTFSGKTVKLGADIVWNEGDAADWATTAPANVWNAIAQTNGEGFLGTFDGQGHTISGLYYNGNGYAALIGRLYGTGKLMNVAVVNSYLKSTTGTESFHHASGMVGRFNNGASITGVYTDAILVAEKAAGVAGFNDGGDISISNCWFDGTIVGTTASTNIGGMIGSVVNNKNHNFTNCLFTGTVSGSSAYAGGIVGIGPYDAATNMTTCLVAGDLTGVTSGTVGAVIGNNPGHNKSVYTNVYATTETHANLKGAGGATFPVTAVATAEILGDAAKTKLTGFDFTNTWATNADSTPVLKAFVAFAPEVTPAVDPTLETTEWYGDGSATEFTISTVGELKGFVTLSQTNTFSGKTVKLGADIVWNEGDAADWATTAPANAWTPIGDQDNGFLGTFDGQGHTISGLYCADINYAGFVARLYSPGVVKNVNIVNSYFRSNGTTKNYSGAGIVSRLQNASVSGIYTDAIFEAVWDAGIVATVPSGTATITNCWFDGTVTAAERAGGILGFANATAVYTLTDCMFTGSISGNKSTGYYGGIVGIGNYNTTIKMSNCLSAGDMSGVTAGTVGAVVGNNPGAGNSTYTNVYATTETHANLKGSGANCAATAVAKADILGDAAKTKLTGFDFTNIWATNANSTPVLKAFVAFAPVVIDPNEKTTAWYDAAETEFTLNTLGEFKGFAELAATNDFAGKTIKLGADIDLGEAAWTPIATFKGTLDGQGHTLSGLKVNVNVGNTNQGMFQTVENATFKNLIIADSSLISGAGSGSNGILAGQASGVTVENVKIANDVTVSGSTNTGIIGTTAGANPVTFKNVWFDGTVNNAMWTAHIGGLLGNAANVAGLIVTVEDCLFTGAVNAAHASSTAENFIGGLVGGTGADVKLYVKNSLSVGTLTIGNPANARNYAGSLVGISSWKGAAYTFYENAYAATETYSVPTFRPADQYTGTPVLTARANLLGDLAKTNAPGLDYVDTWTTVEGKTPVLKVFAD